MAVRALKTAKQKVETVAHEVVTISEPNIRRIQFQIEGTAPLVMHAFDEKTRIEIEERHAAGSKSKSRKTREAKDWEACFQGARHLSEEGWDGIPAPAFRAAMIDACRLVGFKMTHAKLSIFVVADGLDKADGTPLVRVQGGEPEVLKKSVRNETGVLDIRWRPMWRRWGASLVIEYDADQFSATDVTNLLARAGLQCGICEGRPNSKKSFGQGWGTFRIAGE